MSKKLKSIWLCVLISLLNLCHADFADCLKKVKDPKAKEQRIKNIDSIYIINLDNKQERLQKCLAQFAPYKIFPCRFPAVNGWELSSETINEVGVKFRPGMFSDEWVLWSPPEKSGLLEHDFLREECYGHTVFFHWMSLGGIGCALSHISVLQNAYDAGYETIWTMEDDIVVQRDPHLLSDLIAKLDRSVGKNGWDILYTDTDVQTKSLYPEEEDFESDLKSDLWFYWRPDVGLKDQKQLAKRTVLNEDFVQIGSRILAHSMIIRRSGMKKILDFIKTHHIFLPYDHELANIPNLRMFNLRYDIVNAQHNESDTDYNCNKKKQEDRWEACKKTALNELTNVHGWRNPQKAERVMNFVYEKRPSICVEVGSFGGYITYPIATTLQFLKKGVVYAIDAWDVEAAIEGLEKTKKIEWWKSVDMEAIHAHFSGLLTKHQLEKCCHPLRMCSREAASQFADNSVDFLFLDGNESQHGSLEDVLLYYPKVKGDGYIWLNNANTRNQATAFLMKTCEWIKDPSLGIDCLIFKKSIQK